MRASDRAYRALREEILDGVLAPGTALAEVEQANRLGVSRTPVREALARLEADGLATAASPRVLQVSELSPASITALYELREALEEQAARLAAMRRDPERFEGLRSRLQLSPGQLASGDEGGLRDYYETVDALDAELDSAVANPLLDRRPAQRPPALGPCAAARTPASRATPCCGIRAPAHRRGDHRRRRLARGPRHSRAPAHEPSSRTRLDRGSSARRAPRSLTDGTPRKVHHAPAPRPNPPQRREPRPRGPARLAARERRDRPGRARRRRDRHGRQPRDRQRRSRRRVDRAQARRVGAQPGAGAPGLDRRRRCDGVRCRCGAPHVARVGRMGQRRRGARARLPRHLPRGRVLAPRRQHPADPRGRAAPRREARPHRPRPRARHRHGLRDPDRPRQGDLPARAQDRPRRPPRPVGRGRHRHAARPRPGDDLPGDRAGAAHHDRHAPVAQGRDLDVEGARPRLRGQDGRRGGRPGDARRDQPRADLRGRRRRHRLAARRTRGLATRCRCPTPGEAKRAILDSYTKEHSAEYQAQAWIDLARKLARASTR